ncbi:SLC13 family permease [Hydrogenophaga sp.]|jgi:sodium-dependent dicarboxylate transporter 2/3/5|uniref:SLC13 family permease n=1 Tax=Hydrogenophaga sp. TaxID=1904254 RepID=UPI00391A9357
MTSTADTHAFSGRRTAALLLLAAALAAITYGGLPWDAAPRKGMALLVFIGCLWLTEALPLAVTALLVPLVALLLGLPGLTTAQALAPFADPIVVLFFGGFALATALRTQQLDRKMAQALMRLAGGHLGRTLGLLLLATALLSLAISNTATAAVMLPLALGLAGSLDPQKDRATLAFVLLSVAYTASLAGLGTVVASPPNAIAARAAGLDFVQWLWIGLPLVVLLVPLMVAVLWCVLRPELNRPIEVAREEIAWTPARWRTLGVFAFAVAGWVFGAAPLKAMGIQSPDSVVALAAAVAVVALGVTSWREVVRHTDWGVLILFGGGLALGELLGSTGASLALGQWVAGALSGQAVWLVLLVVAAFMVLLSEFASNTAAAALLVPVFAAVAEPLGLPSTVLIVVVALAASCGFALPVATPPNALVFGTGLVGSRQMLRAGLALDATCIAVVTAWGWLALRWLG